MAYIYDLADVWASSGTTFTGIKLNVTDTASSVSSLLMDLQVGGVSQFSVDKAGQVRFSAGSDFTLINSDRISFNYFSTGETLRIRGDDGSNNGSGSGILNRSTGIIAWQSTARTDAGTTDLILTRDAANTLAQRNGVNAQAFNLYNTYTDASNYERGFMRWVSNRLDIGVEAAGTGTIRTVNFPAGFQLGGSTTVLPNGISYTDWNSTFGFSGGTSYGQSSSNEAPLIRFGGSPLLLLGGTTSSFPAIKRDTTSLQARLADDSAFTNIQGKLTTDTAYTAGAPTATGYIVLFDSTGTAYRVPAVAN